jgi:hypothetical protein
LEGAESLIPLLDTLVEDSGAQGVTEVVLGMAHRGRLNVLSNILDKPLGAIAKEFEDNSPKTFQGSGDVKYHLGYSSERVTAAGPVVTLSLAFNPSHLEAVNPVVEGRVRARHDRLGGGKAAIKQVLPVLLHGDAAFAGQGSSPRRSTSPTSPGTAPAAPFTSSSTTRSASRRRPMRPARRLTRRTWRGCSPCRSSTSTAKTSTP